MIAVQAEQGGGMTERDRLYRESDGAPGDFVFDERVVRVFPDMIQRSVPGYAMLVPMLGMLARRYAQPGGTLYDLGCSLGAVALAMQGAVRAPGARIVAVDNSEAMIQALEARLASLAPPAGAPPLEVRLQDIEETPIEDASVTVLNFTLQFVPPERRLDLLRRIAAGTRPGGVLLLSEKIRFEDAQEQAAQTAWHHDFKRAQGYSELEIARKREALENVLVPYRISEDLELFRGNGFEVAETFFQWHNFAGFVCVKKPAPAGSAS